MLDKNKYKFTYYCLLLSFITLAIPLLTSSYDLFLFQLVYVFILTTLVYIIEKSVKK